MSPSSAMMVQVLILVLKAEVSCRVSTRRKCSSLCVPGCLLLLVVGTSWTEAACTSTTCVGISCCRNEYTPFREFYRTLWGLTQVPSDIPAEARKVYLNGNVIKNIPAGVFGHLTQCTHLNLESNIISSIDAQAFSGLDSLEDLRLFDNRISVIPVELFTGLSKLKFLGLSKNQISVVTPEMFRRLSYLRFFYLSRNPISVLQPGMFRFMKNLEVIVLESNEFSVIEEGVFSGLESLWKLGLIRNKISVLQSGMFKGLNGLRELHLGSNQVSQIQPEIFTELINLEELHLSGNRISLLQPGLFTELNKLRKLSLSYNQIAGLQRRVFTGLNNLRDLQLNNNQISSIQSNIFRGLENLRFLNIGNNSITMIEEGAFDSLQSLEKVQLYNIAMTKLSPLLFCNLPRRPLQLVLTYTAPIYHNRWDCSSLCWLKHEEQHGTVTWGNRPSHPRCINDGDWSSLQCGNSGESSQPSGSLYLVRSCLVQVRKPTKVNVMILTTHCCFTDVWLKNYLFWSDSVESILASLSWYTLLCEKPKWLQLHISVLFIVLREEHISSYPINNIECNCVLFFSFMRCMSRTRRYLLCNKNQVQWTLRPRFPGDIHMLWWYNWNHHLSEQWELDPKTHMPR